MWRDSGLQAPRDRSHLVRFIGALAVISISLTLAATRALATDPAPRNGCPGPITVTHTDSDFEIGSYILQQGFAEDEILAAQYSVDPDRFPITIRSIDFLIAQQETIVPTETAYTLMIWDGPPDPAAGGMLVVQLFSGPGEDLPNVIMSAGAPRATLVSLTIDPDDPIQIQILNNSNTNSFSVGVRIDHLNHPPSDPCEQPPDVERNAFPVVDISGVADEQRNWIYAIDCGAFGCPPGWNRFFGYPCEPSGDWVIRASYECDVSMDPGACCHVNGDCEEMVEFTCYLAGGIFFTGQTCSEVTCPEPTGGCCAFGTCLTGQTEAECTGFAGTYLGHGTNCDGDPCALGACCMVDGSCEELIELECQQAGGTFQGIGTDCDSANCPQPTGACCFGTLCVDDQAQDTCEAGGTGEWVGPGTTCDCNPCIGIDQADPPSGTVDARQPHELYDDAARLGIGSADEPITITLGEGGLESCFTVCETAADPLLGANAISSVVDLGGGTYEITLDHAITAGAVTTIQYGGDGSFIAYVSHPANADADGAAAPADVLAIIDMLNGVASPQHGIYSQDMDHDGEFAPADILRTIDLLNGAGEFVPWYNTLLPDNTSCP